MGPDGQALRQVTRLKYVSRRRYAMRVGIIGNGDIGQALGRGFANLGHEVMIGSRTPRSDKLKAWVAEVWARGSSGTFDETAEYGEIVVLATLGGATEAAIDMAGLGSFGGKLVIDVTNPLDFSKGVPPTLFVGVTDPRASAFKEATRGESGQVFQHRS